VLGTRERQRAAVGWFLHLYQGVAWPGTNEGTFVPVLALTRYKCGLTGRLGVLSSTRGTNVICTGGKNARYK
jgi:hypothetical protein